MPELPVARGSILPSIRQGLQPSPGHVSSLYTANYLAAITLAVAKNLRRRSAAPSNALRVRGRNILVLVVY